MDVCFHTAMNKLCIHIYTMHGSVIIRIRSYRRGTLGSHGCPSCGREYRYKRNLVYHLKNECGKEPQYKCPHCRHRTKHKGSLKKHIYNIHSNLLRVQNAEGGISDFTSPNMLEIISLGP
ncbi:hypothetical protein GE061_003372 [Apolygus lucorum]|uniref:C2H2-type domain-containing protein n=1 Tax=Apolygus lucorum TaxID=248454 RepID=A0A8S9X3D0_APOLU|nr:hypothetical protein GE061_003372 [Apolygus lucorum]